MDLWWLEQRAVDVPAHDEWLSARERETLATFRFAKRRADWRLGRWTAKQAVAAFFSNRALSQIEIIARASGAPAVFVSGVLAKTAVSISHREGTAACALAAQGVIGCDLEIIEPRSDAFIRDYFTAVEKLALSYAEEPMRMAAVIWSAKESAFKALGEGLRMDTRSAEVTQVVDGGHGWGPLRVKCDTGEVFEGWWRQGDGMVRTLVSRPAGVPRLITAQEAGNQKQHHVRSSIDD